MKPEHAQQVLALEGHLDRHDSFLKTSRAEYLTYTADSIDMLPFQTKLVKQALSAKRTWTAELATGIGKSVIAARIAHERLHDGPVIYVSPSAASIGDVQDGVVNKFLRTFAAHDKPNVELGQLNDLSLANDISFMTPRALVALMKREPQRVSSILRRASCFIVDEAHHFPDDEAGDLRVFGELYKAASEYVKDGLTVAMTGTWSRLDRKRIMGCEKPDARLTVQDAVDLRRCPELYGIQVITDVRAKKAHAYGDLYDFHLTPEERLQYFAGVVDCMLSVRRRYPVPFAAFARTKSDAIAIATRFNKSSNLGNKGLVVLTADTPVGVRKQAVREIADGKVAGYITCAVGEEALDVPPLEVVHLVRRTRSYTRNMQAIGRALRVCEGKRRALVVDYQTALEGVVDRFMGVDLDGVSDAFGSRVSNENRKNGGPLVCQDANQTASFIGMSMREERELVCISQPCHLTKKQELLDRATRGESRPSHGNKSNATEYRLAKALTNYVHESSKAYDPNFTSKLFEIRPDWRLIPPDAAKRKRELLKMAAGGKPRPTTKTNCLLLKCLCRYSIPSSNSYDHVFAEKLRKIRPDWFMARSDKYKNQFLEMARLGEPRPVSQTLRNYLFMDVAFKDEILAIRPDWEYLPKIKVPSTHKEELLKLARAGAPRPSGRNSLAHAIARFCTRVSSTSHDEALTQELKTTRPDWFISSADKTKQLLLDQAQIGGARPNKNTNQKLYNLLWLYTTVDSKIYDEEFANKLHAIRPDWKHARNKRTTGIGHKRTYRPIADRKAA